MLGNIFLGTILKVYAWLSREIMTQLLQPVASKSEQSVWQHPQKVTGHRSRGWKIPRKMELVFSCGTSHMRIFHDICMST